MPIEEYRTPRPRLDTDSESQVIAELQAEATLNRTIAKVESRVSS
jgi:hypothetical protein